ncbi:MAG: hypothetical protein QI197_07520 [Candidatus Korarchaeota archaeon]|nr:hypothetical protein [Candidatus Korarchaeota archaeon]
MEAKYLVIIPALAALAIAGLVAYSFLLKENPSQPTQGHGKWYVTITYPLNQTMKEGSGSIGLSSYAITLTLSFFSGGNLNETSILVGPLGTVPQGNVTLLITLSGETGVHIFPRNSTVRIQGSSQEDLYAATDRLILAIAGEYALDLDETRSYLIIVHPKQGSKVGLQWLGKLPLSRVRRVPIYVHGEKYVDLRKMMLGPYWPN